MSESESKWTLDFLDNTTKKEYEAFFKDHPDQRHCQTAYEKDVMENPYFNPAELRIVRMEGKEWKGFYRWKKSNTKIIYYPKGEAKEVITIETGTATGVSYKKKSRRR